MAVVQITPKVSALTMKDKLHDIKHRFDTSEHGGAPLLGISKPVIKAHGSSDAKAFSSAIRQAIGCVDNGVTDIIATEAKKLAADKLAQKEKASAESNSSQE